MDLATRWSNLFVGMSPASFFNFSFLPKYGVYFLQALGYTLLTEKLPERRGVMIQGMFRSNYVIMGIPVATALLGAARLLKARESELVDANATVKLLFQPGEETFEGARAAIADGLLQNPRPQVAFAMHVNSQSPLGLVLYGSPALSGVYSFRITLQGKGGHGSSPEICIDPITAGVHVHLALQELIAREVPAAKEVALTVGKFAGGLAANVIPDTCVLEGTLRGDRKSVV